MQIGKSESGDSVAVDRDGVVRGSVVGRVEPALITRIASALRCTPGRPYGSEEWDADTGASAMMSNNKEGMYNIGYPTDRYIQIGDSGLIRVEAIRDVNLVFRLILREPPKTPAILFNERFMAARHKEGYYRKRTIHIFSCVQRSFGR